MITVKQDAFNAFESWVESIGGYPSCGINQSLESYQEFLWNEFSKCHEIADNISIDAEKYVYQAAKNWYNS